MPSKVTFGDGNTISYVYAANGTKLRTVHTTGTDTLTTDYCGNVIYENGVAKLLLTETGYVTLEDSTYHYYVQDHQGNNRMVQNEQVRSLSQKYGLDKSQQDVLHNLISGQGYGYHEVEQLIKDYFKK